MTRAGLLLALACNACAPALPADRPGKGDTGLVVRIPDSPIDCEREILGIVSVRAPATNQAGLLPGIRRRARALGGDRIVDIEYRKLGDVAQLSGLAARCSQLLAGRDYVILRTISVSAPAGDHEGALQAISDKATAMNATLVVSLDYEQGQGDGILRLTGKAARYVPKGWGHGYRGIPVIPDDGNDPGSKRRKKPPAPGVHCTDPTGTNDDARGKHDPNRPPVGNCGLRF